MKPDLRADYKIRLYTGPKTPFFEVSRSSSAAARDFECSTDRGYHSGGGGSDPFEPACDCLMRGDSLAAFRWAGARITFATPVTDCDARRWAEGQARPALPVGRSAWSRPVIRLLTKGGERMFKPYKPHQIE